MISVPLRLLLSNFSTFYFANAIPESRYTGYSCGWLTVICHSAERRG